MMRRHRYALSAYNGWLPEERRATIPIQQAAYRSGTLVRPTRCTICGFDRPAQPSDIILHSERYDMPLTGYGCCRRCHNVLHLRFEQPERWLRLLERVSAADCWARRLCLDPASQWRPFFDTYPSDLPGS
jgi:hypothetical protein